MAVYGSISLQLPLSCTAYMEPFGPRAHFWLLASVLPPLANRKRSAAHKPLHRSRNSPGTPYSEERRDPHPLHAIDATGTVYRATLYYTRVFTFCAQLSAARAA